MLPTGAGNKEVVLPATDAVRRDRLVMAPSLDLVTQWHRLLDDRLRHDAGVIGGDDYRVASIAS